MKKIFLIVLVFICFKLAAQNPFPINATNGSPTTGLMTKGRHSVDSLLQINTTCFSDTSAANRGVIDQVGGAMIRTCDNTIWLRNVAANKWVGIGAAGSVSSFTFLTDSTMIICFTSGVCDTISFTNNVFITNSTVVNTVNGDTLITCTTTGSGTVCDTLIFTGGGDIFNYYYLNDSTAVICGDTTIVCNVDTCIVQQVCDTLSIPRIRSIIYQNGVNNQNNGIVQLGSTTGHPPSWLQGNTDLNTFYSSYYVYGNPLFKYPLIVQNRLNPWFGGGVAQFLDNIGQTQLGINYITAQPESGYTGHWGNRTGFWIGANIQGYIPSAPSNLYLYANDSYAKYSSIFFNTKDTANDEAITFFVSPAPGLNPFVLDADTTDAFRIYTNKQIAASKYGQNRFANTPVTAAGFDANGKIVEFAPSGTNITIINDTTITICSFGDYLCDTFITTTVNPIQYVTILNDSMLLVCDSANVCDTFSIPTSTGIGIDRGFFDPNQIAAGSTYHQTNNYNFSVGNGLITSPTGTSGNYNFGVNNSIVANATRNFVALTGNSVGGSENVVFGRNMVIGNTSNTNFAAATDGSISNANYAAVFGDANDVRGTASLTAGFGNDNYVENGFITGNDNVLGALSAGTGTPNQYTSAWGIGTQIRTTGHRNGTLGYLLQNTGVQSYLMGHGFGSTRMVNSQNSRIAFGTNSDSATLIIDAAAGTTGTYGATFARGTFSVGSVSNDNAETRVLVQNSSFGSAIEYRDASSFGTTYTFTNGLTESPAGTVGLYGTQTKRDTIYTGPYSFTFTGATTTDTADALFKITNTAGGGSAALKVTAASGGYGIIASGFSYGVYGTGSTGVFGGGGTGVYGDGTVYGVRGVSSSAVAVFGEADAGTGVSGKAGSSGVPGLFYNVNGTGADALINTVLDLQHRTGGAIADGAGLKVKFSSPTADSVTRLTNEIISIFTDKTVLTRTSQLSFTAVNSGTTATKLVIEGDGRIYGTGLHNSAGAVTGTTNQYIASGTFTPGLTNVSNVGASTAYECQWMRVGNVVTVSGKVDIDATAPGATELGLALPIASAMTAEENLGGDAISAAAASLSAAVRADATNDRAAIIFIATSLTNDSYFFTFTYLIK